MSCDYCNVVEKLDDAEDYPVFEDIYSGVWPIEQCDVMACTDTHELYLVRHANDWYLAMVNTSDGTGDTVHVTHCPCCGREL